MAILRDGRPEAKADVATSGLTSRCGCYQRAASWHHRQLSIQLAPPLRCR